MPATLLIELTKPLGDPNDGDHHKAGDRLRATLTAIKHAGLEPGDYKPLGTYPGPTPSDLPEPPAEAPPAPPAPVADALPTA